MSANWLEPVHFITLFNSSVAARLTTINHAFSTWQISNLFLVIILSCELPKVMCPQSRQEYLPSGACDNSNVNKLSSKMKSKCNKQEYLSSIFFQTISRFSETGKHSFLVFIKLGWKKFCIYFILGNEICSYNVAVWALNLTRAKFYGEFTTWWQITFVQPAGWGRQNIQVLGISRCVQQPPTSQFKWRCLWQWRGAFGTLHWEFNATIPAFD